MATKAKRCEDCARALPGCDVRRRFCDQCNAIRRRRIANAYARRKRLKELSTLRINRCLGCRAILPFRPGIGVQPKRCATCRHARQVLRSRRIGRLKAKPVPTHCRDCSAPLKQKRIWGSRGVKRVCDECKAAKAEARATALLKFPRSSGCLMCGAGLPTWNKIGGKQRYCADCKRQRRCAQHERRYAPERERRLRLRLEKACETCLCAIPNAGSGNRRFCDGCRLERWRLMNIANYRRNPQAFKERASEWKRLNKEAVRLSHRWRHEREVLSRGGPLPRIRINQIGPELKEMLRLLVSFRRHARLLKR
jgi:hypothetical protein